jgi:hypothetical protein
VRDAAEPSRLFGELLEAPRGEHADRDHRECEAKAERGHDAEAERDLFELQANDEDRDRGGAGHESASQAENHNLSGGNLSIGETSLDIGARLRMVGA